MPTMIYTFSEHDSEYAFRTWRANCGPNALAFALQIHLDAVRGKIPGFETKHYTSPMMMRAALQNFRRPYEIVTKPTFSDMFSSRVALVRLQWSGPWIVDGKPQKWAARQTHWIVSYRDESGADLVFDVNGGIRSYRSWKEEIVPPLTRCVPRCDGGWYPANVWRLRYER